MSRTSFTVEHELGQRIRRVRMVLSDRAGHVVSMPDTLTVLLDLWDSAEKDRATAGWDGPRDPLTGSYLVPASQAGQ